MRSNRVFLFMFAFVAVIFVFTAILFAQEGVPEDFDWTAFGVNTGVIAGIITITQILKSYIPDSIKKFTILFPIVLSVGAFFIVGGSQPAENVLYWAGAAAYLFKIANKMNILSSVEKKE